MKHLLLVLALGVTMLFTVTGAMGQTNVALGKVATQSGDGTFPNGLASSAVDGNTDGNFFNGSVTHTTFMKYPNWRVELGADHQIDEIKIWNRTDCCAERLNYVSVTVFDTRGGMNWRQDSFPSAAETNPIIIPLNVIGNIVVLTINKAEPAFLSLAEVEVFGSPLGKPAPVPTPRGYSIHTDAASVGEWEKFYINEISNAATGDGSGWYTASIKTKKGSTLWAVNGGGLGCNSDVSPIRTDFVWTQDLSREEEAPTIFTITDLGNGYNSIQTTNGSYLTAYNLGGKGASSLCNPIYTERIASESLLRPEHKFKIVGGGGKFGSFGEKAIQTFDGYYLTAVDGGGRK